MEFRWPAGWPELPFTSQLQQGSLEVTSCLPGRPKLRAVVRIFVTEPLEGTATDTTTSQVLRTSWSTASPRTRKWIGWVYWWLLETVRDLAKQDFSGGGFLGGIDDTADNYM